MERSPATHWNSGCRSFLGTDIRALGKGSSGGKSSRGGPSAGRPPDGTPVCAADGVDSSSSGGKSSWGWHRGELVWQRPENSGSSRSRGCGRRNPPVLEWFWVCGGLVWPAAGRTERGLRRGRQRAAAGEVSGALSSAREATGGLRRGRCGGGVWGIARPPESVLRARPAGLGYLSHGHSRSALHRPLALSNRGSVSEKRCPASSATARHASVPYCRASSRTKRRPSGSTASSPFMGVLRRQLVRRPLSRHSHAI